MKVSIFSVADYYKDAHPSVSGFYNDITQVALWAEELGYEGFFIAEHHFHPYGLVPDALQFLTSIAMKTTRLKLGPAISVLPFHKPVRVAEQMALLDQLSEGRLIAGVGSGYLQHEFDGFGLTPADKRQRFDEALEVVQKALTGKRFKHEGKYFNVPKTKLNIGAYEGREVEFKIAILTELASYHVGKRGYGIMTVPYATVEVIDDAKPLFDNYKKGWAESGKSGEGDIFAAIHAHVTPDKDAAHNDMNRQVLEKYVYSRLYAKHSDYDECMRRGVILSGTVDEAVEQLQKIVDTGVTHLQFIVNYGAMPMDQVRQSMELLINEVVPQIREPEPVAA